MLKLRLAFILALLSPSINLAAADLAGNYTDPAYFTSQPSGRYSYWLAPWRSYLETVPAATFVNGIGMNFNLTQGENVDLVMKMLATHGVKRVRIEQGWGESNFDDENTFNNAALFRAKLLAAKNNGVRPLILLNSNSGIPCPTKAFSMTLPNGVSFGATSVTVADPSKVVPGFTGFSHMTEFWAAEVLVTALNGNTATLSKPVLSAGPARSVATMATLKYRPFSVPGSADYIASMNGWNTYVKNVALFAANVLGTTNAADKGFDMEIWNELTFGSHFLSINDYYANAPYAIPNPPQFLTSDGLVYQTASFIAANPTLFSGVEFNDGFTNTMPWNASSAEPAQISAIGKHPYKGRARYPAEDKERTTGGGVKLVNALGQPDNSFVPNFEALLPEYFSTGLQMENQVRDMGPITNTLGGANHGRYARGQALPVPVWITEVNISPWEDNNAVTEAAALALKAKATSRYAAFYLNKGVTQLHFFGADKANGDGGTGNQSLAMVQDNFLALSRQAGAVYPADDSAYVSPALRVLQRMSTAMSNGMDPSLTLSQTRSIVVSSVSENHLHTQFTGDGTAAHPNLYNRDVLAILPYQVNAHRFIIAYYVMTMDYSKTLAPEQYRVKLTGLKGTGSALSVYDPLSDAAIPFTANALDNNSLDLTLTASDSPFFLIIDETAQTPSPPNPPKNLRFK